MIDAFARKCHANFANFERDPSKISHVDRYLTSIIHRARNEPFFHALVARKSSTSSYFYNVQWTCSTSKRFSRGIIFLQTDTRPCNNLLYKTSFKKNPCAIHKVKSITSRPSTHEYHTKLERDYGSQAPLRGASVSPSSWVTQPRAPGFGYTGLIGGWSLLA